MADVKAISADEILRTAQELRARVGIDFHEKLVESVYTEAASLADRSPSVCF